MEVIDISLPIHPEMTVYEGNPPVRVEQVSSLEDGHVAAVSRLVFGSHTGTHVDAPAHFIPDAPASDSIPLEALLGPARVVDARGVADNLSQAALLPLEELPDRVLFKTRNSELWTQRAFNPEYVGLTEGAARQLVDAGVRLVGIDYLSIAPHGDPTPTHLVLLEAGIVILEGLDLSHVEAGEYELLCLPLLIPGCDGAPARAVLRALGCRRSGHA